MSYQVKLTVFEGPLDLLLQLIEKRELDITSVSLAAVTDQYLEYLAALEDLVPDILADFLVTAARLILIKSQALLPRPPAPSEPPQEDLGEDLARQLQEYKRFKQMASLLKERDDKGLHSYLRLATAGITPHVQLDGVTLADLAEAMQRVLTGLPDEVSAPDIVRRQFTIDEKIDLIRDVLRQGRVSFGLLLSRASSRIEAIVTFLALLEMMKQGSAVVEQSGLFGEIMIGPGVAAQTTSGPAPAPSPSDGAAIAMPAPQPE